MAMNARITRFQMRKGVRQDAISALEDLKDRIMALPGVIEVTTVLNADGTGYVIGINTSHAQAEANAAKVAALWAKFAGFMEALPTTGDFDVLAHWTQPAADGA